MSARIRSSRIVDHDQVMPLSSPMVFLVRSYVRTVHTPLDWDWDGGRIASRALGVSDDPVAEYSGLT